MKKISQFIAILIVVAAVVSVAGCFDFSNDGNHTPGISVQETPAPAVTPAQTPAETPAQTPAETPAQTPAPSGTTGGSGLQGNVKNYIKGALLAGPVSIPANSSTPTEVGIVLESGKPYIIVGEGVCSLWGDKTDGVDSCFCYAQWRIGDTPQVWGQLELIDPTVHLSELIEKQTGKPPVYNPSNVYEGVVFGGGMPLKALVYDEGEYGGNNGELRISVYEAIESGSPGSTTGGTTSGLVTGGAASG